MPMLTNLSQSPKRSEAEEFDEQAERQKIRAVFQMIDYDGHGTIGTVEMEELMRTLGKRPLKTKVNCNRT